MNCKYTFEIPNVGACCGAYSQSKRHDGRHWAHYPECANENCPLIHPEFLEDAVLEQCNMYSPYYTAEKLRQQIVDEFWDGKAELGNQYIDWHTEEGKCGLTLFTIGGVFDLIIEKRPDRKEQPK